MQSMTDQCARLNEKIRISFEIFDPKRLEYHLELTAKAEADGKIKQRPVKPKYVQKYAQDIVNGDFKPTAQTISLTDEGYIIDGRNRFTAALKVGKDIIFCVARGCDASLFDSMDIGVPRDINTLLRLDGVANGRFHVGVVNSIVCFACAPHHQLSKHQITHIRDIYGRSSVVIHNIATRVSGTRSAVAFVCAPLAFHHAHDSASAEAFAEAYFGKYGWDRNSPVRALSIWIEQHPAYSMRRAYGPCVVFNCLKAFIDKVPMDKAFSTETGLQWALSQQRKNIETITTILGR